MVSTIRAPTLTLQKACFAQVTYYGLYRCIVRSLEGVISFLRLDLNITLANLEIRDETSPHAHTFSTSPMFPAGLKWKAGINFKKKHNSHV